MNHSIKLFPGIIGLAFLFLSCAINYGSLSTNTKVTRYFKTGFIPEAYTYYYNGWKGEPYAIIGLKPGYDFESKTWKRFDPGQQSVRTLINRMYNRESTRFHGAWILDPEGEQIGIWFSDSRSATIKMSGKNRIAFITPDPGRGYGLPAQWKN